MENKKEKIKEIVSKIEKKEFGIYFFTMDTKGNPVASIATIYEHVKSLIELGYNAYILHEKNDYKLRANPNDPNDTIGISEWLGEEYANLPHVSIEKQELKLSAIDYIIIPEIFSSIMKQVMSLPCTKIVLCQSYNYALELMGVGDSWNKTYGFNHVITTSEPQESYIKSLFNNIHTYIIPPSIPDYFKPTKELKSPIISIVCRNQSDVLKIVKSFYLQYPMYNWISFKELKGLPKQIFAKELGKSCLAIWVDEVSGFGTFPIEAMKCETPIIGKIPNLLPEWMKSEDKEGNILIKNNGMWTNNILSIPSLIANYMESWLEDYEPKDMLNESNKIKNNYSIDNQKNKIKEVYGNIISNRKHEFEALLNKDK